MSRSVDLRRRCSAQSGQHARSRVRQQRGVLAPPGDDWHGWGCLGRGRAVVGGRTSETCGSPSAPVCRAGSVSAAEARCAQLLRGVHPPSRPRQSMIGSQSARCVGRWRWAEPVERRTHRHQLPVRSRGPECSFAGAHRPCAPATAASRNARPVSDALQRCTPPPNVPPPSARARRQLGARACMRRPWVAAGQVEAGAAGGSNTACWPRRLGARAWIVATLRSPSSQSWPSETQSHTSFAAPPAYMHAGHVSPGLGAPPRSERAPKSVGSAKTG